MLTYSLLTLLVILALLGLVVLLGVLVLVLVLRRPGGAAVRGGKGPSALDIVHERYARGEISDEQYNEMFQDLTD